MDNFDLKKYLSEGKLRKENAIGPTQVTGVYELTTYQVEYDNGTMGYMYHLTDEDGGENDLGIDQLYFSEDGKEMEFGVDFEETDLLGSQSKQVLKGEALQIFKDLKNGNVSEGKEKIDENTLPENTDLEPMFMELLEAYNNYIFEEYGNNPGKLDDGDAKEFIRAMNFSDHEFMNYVGN